MKIPDLFFTKKRIVLDVDQKGIGAPGTGKPDLGLHRPRNNQFMAHALQMQAIPDHPLHNNPCIFFQPKDFRRFLPLYILPFGFSIQFSEIVFRDSS